MSSRKLCQFLCLTFVSFHSTYAIAQGKELHSSVPDICPSNRTVIRQDPVSGFTILGEVDEDMILTNTVSALEENSSLTNFFINSSGLYLHSQPIPQDGTIIQFRAFGYLSDAYLNDTNAEMNRSIEFTFSAVPYLFVVVYRPDFKRDLYDLVHEPVRITHEFHPGVLPSDGLLNWQVKGGDMVGVLIPGTCDDSLGSLMCPSQANLRTKEGECFSALYSLGMVGALERLPRGEFREVSVKLNMEAVLSVGENGALDPGIIAGAVLTALIALCIVVVIIVLLVTRFYKSKTKSTGGPATTLSDEELHIYEEPEDLVGDHFTVNPFAEYEVVGNDSASEFASGGSKKSAPDVMTENDAYNAVTVECGADYDNNGGYDVVEERKSPNGCKVVTHNDIGSSEALTRMTVNSAYMATRSSDEYTANDGKDSGASFNQEDQG